MAEPGVGLLFLLPLGAERWWSQLKALPCLLPFSTPHRGPWGLLPQEILWTTKDIQQRLTTQMALGSLRFQMLLAQSRWLFHWWQTSACVLLALLAVCESVISFQPFPESLLPNSRSQRHRLPALQCSGHTVDAKWWVLGPSNLPTQQGRPGALALSLAKEPPTQRSRPL